MKKRDSFKPCGQKKCGFEPDSNNHMCWLKRPLFLLLEGFPLDLRELRALVRSDTDDGEKF